MKRLLFPICLGLAAGVMPLSADETEDRVKEIRAYYATLEGVKFRKEATDFEIKDEPVSGTWTRFYQGEQLVKVTLSYSAGDHGGSDESFYYREGKLVFAHVVDSSWRFGPSSKPEEPSTIDTLIEHRVYFADEKPIRHLFKEVSAQDAKQLAELLAKAPNRPCEDKERQARIIRHGKTLPQAKTAAELTKLLQASLE